MQIEGADAHAQGSTSAGRKRSAKNSTRAQRTNGAAHVSDSDAPPLTGSGALSGDSGMNTQGMHVHVTALEGVMAATTQVHAFPDDVDARMQGQHVHADSMGTLSANQACDSQSSSDLHVQVREYDDANNQSSAICAERGHFVGFMALHSGIALAAQQPAATGTDGNWDMRQNHGHPAHCPPAMVSTAATQLIYGPSHPHDVAAINTLAHGLARGDAVTCAKQTAHAGCAPDDSSAAAAARGSHTHGQVLPRTLCTDTPPRTTQVLRRSPPAVSQGNGSAASRHGDSHTCVEQRAGTLVLRRELPQVAARTRTETVCQASQSPHNASDSLSLGHSQGQSNRETQSQDLSRVSQTQTQAQDHTQAQTQTEAQTQTQDQTQTQTQTQDYTQTQNQTQDYTQTQTQTQTQDYTQTQIQTQTQDYTQTQIQTQDYTQTQTQTQTQDYTQTQTHDHTQTERQGLPHDSDSSALTGHTGSACTVQTPRPASMFDVGTARIQPESCDQEGPGASQTANASHELHANMNSELAAHEHTRVGAELRAAGLAAVAVSAANLHKDQAVADAESLKSARVSARHGAGGCEEVSVPEATAAVPHESAETLPRRLEKRAREQDSASNSHAASCSDSMHARQDNCAQKRQQGAAAHAEESVHPPPAGMHEASVRDSCVHVERQSASLNTAGGDMAQSRESATCSQRATSNTGDSVDGALNRARASPLTQNSSAGPNLNRGLPAETHNAGALLMQGTHSRSRDVTCASLRGNVADGSRRPQASMHACQASRADGDDHGTNDQHNDVYRQHVAHDTAAAHRAVASISDSSQKIHHSHSNSHGNRSEGDAAMSRASASARTSSGHDRGIPEVGTDYTSRAAACSPRETDSERDSSKQSTEGPYADRQTGEPATMERNEQIRDGAQAGSEAPRADGADSHDSGANQPPAKKKRFMVKFANFKK
jgi:hypothetical protein